jgi:hypothetical protein
VCKRFAALSCAPELLRDLRVEIRGARVLQRAHTLVAWLSQHGPAVESLTLWLVPPTGASNAIMAHLAASEACCLDACSGAAVHLRMLELSAPYPLATAAWLPGMRALEIVSIRREGWELRLPYYTYRLTNLRSLQLHGSPVVLPASLTSLRLMGHTSGSMSPQVGWSLR